MLSIGVVIESGFRLIRDHPLAVAAWGAIMAVGQLGMMLLMRPFYAAQAAMMQPGSSVNPADLVSAMVPVYGYQFLLLLLMVVVWTAAFRAILRPAESNAAYLRLGMDELRVLGLTLLVGFLFFVLMMVLIFALSGIAFGLIGTGNRGAGIAIMLLLGLVLLCLIIWVLVRLSLAGPLTVYRREFTFAEGWRLSKGHFWTLFIAYLVIGVMILVISTIISALTMGSYWLEMMRNFAQPAAVQGLAEAQADRLGSFSPMLVLMVLGSGVTGALWIALGAGAAAGATRQLIGVDHSDIEEVFA